MRSQHSEDCSGDQDVHSPEGSTPEAPAWHRTCAGGVAMTVTWGAPPGGLMALKGTRCARVVPAAQPASTAGSSGANSGYASARLPSRAEHGSAYAAAVSRCQPASACAQRHRP
jgi:hypothetical protein